MTKSTGMEYAPSRWEQVRHYVGRIPYSAAISPGLALIGTAFGLSALAVVPEAASLRLFLSGLATAQASLIAIVFAVTILAIQLTADRYTMRIGPIFYRHPVFQLTLAAFLISIAADLALLFLQGYMATPLYQAALYAAIGYAMGNGWLFVLYIRTSIWLNTPEGVIGVIGEETTPSRFFSQLQSESPIGPTHPLLPIYSVARRAIDADEFETAQTAIQYYGRLAADILKEGMENDVFAALPREKRRKAVDEMFDRHLPDLALRAVEGDEATLANEAIELQGDLAEIGLATDQHLITAPAFRGLANLSRVDAPAEMDYYRIHSGVWTQLGSVLVAAAEYPAPRAVDHLIISAKSVVTQQLGYDFSFDIHPDIVTGYLEDLQDVQSALFEEHGEEICAFDFDWLRGVDEGSEPSGVVALLRCRDHVFDISGSVLQLIEDGDRFPVSDGTFRHLWKEMTIEAIDNGPPGYGQTWCEAMIELAYIQPLRSRRDHHFWTYPLAEVMTEADPTVVEAAFDRILDFEPRGEKRDDGLSVSMVAERGNRYHNHLDARFPSLNTHVHFPGRVEEIREHVRNRHTEIVAEAEEAEESDKEGTDGA